MTKIVRGMRSVSLLMRGLVVCICGFAPVTLLGGTLAIEATDITESSFSLSWHPVEGAASYRISVWTNALRGASEGSTIWRESFSNAPASTATAAIRNDEALYGAFADNIGWSIVSNVYPSIDAGTIRIGNTSKPGALLAPANVVAAGTTLLVRARRQTTSEGSRLSVWKIAPGGEPESIGEAIEIGVESTLCHWILPAIAADERLLFRSAAGKSSHRTLLDEVSLVEEYSPGTVQADYAVEGLAVTSNGFAAASLATAVWTVAVEAIANGEVMCAATNTVDLANPPPEPQRYVPLSGLARRSGKSIWHEDFSAFATVFAGDDSQADWRNGLTLGAWQAFLGGTAFGTITRNHGAKTAMGLYAYWETNKVAATYALGTMTSSSAQEIVYGLAFRNDTPLRVETVTVRYDGVQFGFRNKDIQSLFYEYRTAEEQYSVLSEGPWTTDGELSFETLADADSNLASGADEPLRRTRSSGARNIKIPPGGCFVLRWRRPRASYSAALAIDNVEVVFGFRPDASVITLR